MKNFVLFCLLLMTCPILGQESKVAASNDFPDFIKVIKQTNLPIKINKIDTILELFSENNWDTDFDIVSNNQMISKRRYFPNTKIINKEFIRVNKFKYHYLENDSLNNNRLIAEGDFIVSVNPLMSIDTIQTIDPNTYETIEQIIKRPKLLKDGEWFESDSVFLYRGNYKNDKREGKWTKHKRNYGIEEAELTYKNGTLIETKLNLLSKGDTNAIKAALIGKWCREAPYNIETYTWNFTKSNCLSKIYFKFNENGVFEFYHKNDHSPLLDSWEINDKLELQFFQNKHFKLIKLSENELQLEVLGKF
jgi:hypothetical protein